MTLGPSPFETLEPRTHLSAVTADLLGGIASHVLENSTQRRVTPALAVPLVTTRPPYPQVTGTWIGTVKTAGKRGLVEVAVRITRQVNGGATGKFALGPVTAWHKVLSTAVVSPTRDRSFRVILPGDTFYGSVSATVSSDGKQIIGRWTCNNDGNWKSGTIVLNRQ